MILLLHLKIKTNSFNVFEVQRKTKPKSIHLIVVSVTNPLFIWFFESLFAWWTQCLKIKWDGQKERSWQRWWPTSKVSMASICPCQYRHDTNTHLQTQREICWKIFFFQVQSLYHAIASCCWLANEKSVVNDIVKENH